VKHINT